MAYNNKDIQARAEALTAQLTTEEQAAQLRYDAPAVERVGLPAYNWWNEGLHGVARAGTATVFPQAIGLAAMFDEEFMRSVGEVTALEARAKYNAASRRGDRDIYKGLTLWSPNVNIFRDPRWGRGHETLGEDPYLTSRLGAAYVKGVQGEGEYLTAAACAKHFAVHSGPEALRHEFDAKASPKDMEETYLPAFRALVGAQAEGVMGAYNRVNGEPACASGFLMGKLREWGFDGYFVSDCWALRDFHTTHMVTANAAQSAAMALKAGCDINCGNTYLHTLEALRKGLCTEQDISRACTHAMRTRLRLGLMDKTPLDDVPYDVVSCTAHKRLSQECAEKSAVLLRNNGVLPLDKGKLRSVAVIGPNADSRAALVGNYFGTADRYVTFLEGIEDAFDGRVYYAEGCALYADRSQTLAQAGDRYAEALACAECADVIIACVGLDATLEGEEGDTGNEFASGDKPDLRLPECQRELLRRLRAVGKPLVVVLAAGSAVNIECECDALLDMWYAGQYGGRALARLLFGEISPSGRLPVTFYKQAESLPEFSDYSMQGRTYRYCSGDNVLYPFGFGLSYAELSVSAADITHERVSAEITNASGIAADAVVQVYVSAQCGVENAPRLSLAGFKRVSVPAGGTAQTVIPLPREAFETVDEAGVRAVRSGRYRIYAGLCQPTELSESLGGGRCFCTEIEL